MAISDVIAALEEAVNSTIGKSNFKPINVMLDNLKTAIDSNIAAQIQAVQTSIASVEATANSANSTATAAAANKMDKTNPSGTGIFSVSRTANTNVGNQSFAFRGEASGTNTIAMGNNSSAKQSSGIAIGVNAQNNSSSGITIGSGAVSSNGNTDYTGNIAIGFGAATNGSHSIALGRGASASINSSLALGAYATASSSNAIAIGNAESVSYLTQATAQLSISIGHRATASGMYAISIGSNAKTDTTITQVSGADSIAIGRGAAALRDDSLSIGHGAMSDGTSSVNLGLNSKVSSPSNSITTQSIAIGVSAEARGGYNIAIGPSAKAGYMTGSTEYNSIIAIGWNATASSIESMAIGVAATATYPDSIAMGPYANAPQALTVAIGYQATASGQASVAIGSGSATANPVTSAGNYSIALGYNSTATGDDSISIGRGAHADKSDGLAIGHGSAAAGENSVALGPYAYCNASGSILIAAGGAGTNSISSLSPNCVAIGKSVTISASASTSIAIGYNVTVNNSGNNSGQFALGYGVYTPVGVTSSGTYVNTYNKTDSSGAGRFVVGNGTGYSSLSSNCFRVTDSGVYAKGNYNTSGADYAEMFEWADGNPESEDRAGRFVTLDGELISLAESEDVFILGIVSAAPSICGDAASEDWQGRFKRDIFGRLLFEDLEIPAKIDGETDKEIMPARTENWYVQNENWNSDEVYTPREDRPEWDPVGLLGKLVMIDDGTAEVNGYVMPSTGGIATKADHTTKFRVMKRIDDTHIKVLLLGFSS